MEVPGVLFGNRVQLLFGDFLQPGFQAADGFGLKVILHQRTIKGVVRWVGYHAGSGRELGTLPLAADEDVRLSQCCIHILITRNDVKSRIEPLVADHPVAGQQIVCDQPGVCHCCWGEKIDHQVLNLSQRPR